MLEKLLKCEMIVMMGVRNPEGSRKSVEEALGVELTKGRIFYEQCDTGDLESVKQFAKKVQQKFPAFHLLINNGERQKLPSSLSLIIYLPIFIILAGVMCTPYKESKDGFESQMAINYLGHFLLTHLLMPQLIAGSNNNDGLNARVINVSSCVHKYTDMDYEDFNCK